MNFSRISYLTEELELQREEMSNTLEWDSRDKSLLKPNGCRSRWWGIFTLTYWTIDSIFWGSEGLEWGGMIRCLVFSSKIKVLKMAQNLNDHVCLSKTIPSQLVSLKSEFLWRRYHVFPTLLNKGFFEKKCTVTAQWAVCTADVVCD